MCSPSRIFSDQRLINSFKKMQEVGKAANKPQVIKDDNEHEVMAEAECKSGRE